MSKRSYMSAEKRREHLLETAAGILANQGWMGLTMQAVAREGGTSRQLVYEYFPSLKDLTAELLEKLLGDLDRHTEELFSDVNAETEILVQESVQPLMDLNPAQQVALSAALMQQTFPDEELNTLLESLRDRAIERWMGIFQAQYHDIEKADLNLVRAVLLARLSATWSLIEQVNSGQITRDQAMKVIMIMSGRTGDLFAAG